MTLHSRFNPFSRQLILVLLCCFIVSKAVMPPGYMMGNVLDGQFLVLCTANGTSLEFIEYEHDQKDEGSQHSTFMCQLSSANAASLLATNTPPTFLQLALQPTSNFSASLLRQRHYCQHLPRAPPALS